MSGVHCLTTEAKTGSGAGEVFSRLPLGGFLKQSLIDYPGRISAVIYTMGCNFRCVYCHNPELVVSERLAETVPLVNEELFAWLSSNRALLDAVVITGGEPTIHAVLPEFIRRIKTLELEVKLDTNGTNSAMLEGLIDDELVDYVALDIKAPLDYRQYVSICGVQCTESMLDRIRGSLDLLHRAGIPCEVRTTLLRPYHDENDINEIARIIRVPFILQNCRLEKTLQNSAGKVFAKEDILRIIESLEPNRGNVCLR